MDDAVSCCCLHAWQQPAAPVDEQFAAASGLTVAKNISAMWMQTFPLSPGRFNSTDHSVPLRTAALVMDLLREPPGQICRS